MGVVLVSISKSVLPQSTVDYENTDSETKPKSSVEGLPSLNGASHLLR